MLATTRISFALVVASLATMLFAGCMSGAALQQQADYVAEHVERTREAAMRCDAERPFALAESHLTFLEYEMNRGKYVPARRHVDIAVTNIDEVRDIVDDRPECFGVVTVTDSDNDGIPDETDNCPWDPNPDQADEDGDGMGDACEDDLDGDGIVNSLDECPLDPEDFDEFEDDNGCPDRDNDRDGIFDLDDECPNQPEDVDGFEDEDGCPDPDNDNDGIPDISDACPLDPEDIDGDRDEDGCPDASGLVTDLGDRIEISQQINFDTGSARIVGAISFQILDEVAAIIIANSEMTVRIEGHTDSQGSNSYNLELSQDRADSVRDYLVSQGVARERLNAIGYGEERPIADNETAEGRALNRRVEFHVVTR